jgi:hypothetical protein
VALHGFQRVDAAEPPGPSKTSTDKGKGKKPKETAVEKYLQAQHKQAVLDEDEQTAIQANPWYQAGNELASADEAGAQQAEAAMGAGPGSLTAAVSGQAQALALADAGVTPGSQAGQWLQGELNQANANDAPLTAAMNAYQSAYEKTEPAITTSLQDMGAANALAMSVAPEQDYLNLLPGHLGNTDYLSLSGPQTQGLPPGLEYYLRKAGVSGVGGSNSALIPSAGAVLSGGTSPSTPPAVAPATTTNPFS